MDFPPFIRIRHAECIWQIRIPSTALQIFDHTSLHMRSLARLPASSVALALGSSHVLLYRRRVGSVYMEARLG
jgi:hypothetical protein